MHEATHSILPDIKRIAVLRPNAVGDFVMALPALHALKSTYPAAEITYLGKQWHADFLAARPSPIERVVIVPPCPGIGIPANAAVDPVPLQRFIDDMRVARFDLAIQLYGGGRYSNPFVKQLDARLTIGLRASDAEPLDRWLPYGRVVNRRLEMLGVAALAGARTLHIGPELQATAADRAEAQAVTGGLHGKRLVVLQPGATDPRRRWPPERFATVADLCAKRGASIAVNGSAEEAPLIAEVLERMQYPALNLAGRLSLSGLCGLLERADLLISNDTGPLHLALAIGTPSVGIYWLTNLVESGPLRQDMHRAALSACSHCPVCGTENMKTRCEHNLSFVADVTTEEVAALAEELLAGC